MVQTLDKINTWMKKANVVFHMEPKMVGDQGYIATYGTYSGSFTIDKVTIDKQSSFYNLKPIFRGHKDIPRSFITLDSNLYGFVSTTQEYTITFWMLMSDLKDGILHHPYADYNASGKGTPLQEFIFDENDAFTFHTEDYTSAVRGRTIIPNNKWCFVLISVDCNQHNQDRLRLYVDGKLVSLGYTDIDYNPISLGMKKNTNTIASSSKINKWEFLGFPTAGSYSLAEFTIYNKCLEKVEEFGVPTNSTAQLLSLTLNNAKQIPFDPTGTNDPTPLGPPPVLWDEGVYIRTHYDKTPSNRVPIKYPRTMSKVAIIGDEWAKRSHIQNVPSYLGLTIDVNVPQNNADSNKIRQQFDKYVLPKAEHLDFLLFTMGLHDLELPIKTTMDNFKYIYITSYNHWCIPILVTYGRVSYEFHDREVYLAHLQFLHMELLRYFQKDITDIPPFIFYLDMYTMELINWSILQGTTYQNPLKLTVDNYTTDGLHIRDPLNVTDSGSWPQNDPTAYAVVKVMQEVIRIFREYDHPKISHWDIYSRMTVEEKVLRKEIYPCKVNVSVTEQYIELPIPWPNDGMFKDETPFILIAPDGRYVADYYYRMIDGNTKLRFIDGKNPFNSGLTQQFKFIFYHKHGFYEVRKYTHNIVATSTSHTYKFNTIFNHTVDLNQRVQVFVDGKFLAPYSDLYYFDNTTGNITFHSSIAISAGTMISFLCIYTGTGKENDRVVPMLHPSGYIEFAKKHADRVWNKDLFAVFLNGKLVSKDDIIDMSSTVHKIGRDLKSRYDLQVLNMSPSISYLTPLLRTFHTKSYDKTYVREIMSSVHVGKPPILKPRYYVNPDILNPVEWHHLVPDNMEWYISLIHHGTTKAEKKKDLKYTLKFFRDLYADDPEPVKVIGQIRLKGNTEQFYPEHPTQTLIGTLPSTLTNVVNDVCLMSIKAKTIYDADSEFTQKITSIRDGGVAVQVPKYENSIDGIMGRLEINEQHIDDWHRLYYELTTDNYERDIEVEVLEWRISSEKNGKGEIWYQMTIPFLSWNTPHFPEEDE